MLPTALSIAGLDPSGGAGLAADLRAFQAAGVWGAAVCAAFTVQSTQGLRAVAPVRAALLMAQAEAVFADHDVRALKTGALASSANARAVRILAEARPSIPFVVDPVMAPTLAHGLPRRGSLGAPLAAMRALAAAATLLTPNLGEAGKLLGAELETDDDARAAAMALLELGPRAVLVKGGHGKGPEALDFLALRGASRGPLRIARPRRRIPEVHGTGCTLAALIAGRLASLPRDRRRPLTDADLVGAVRWARSRLDRALASPLTIGKGSKVLAVSAARRSA